MMPWSLAVVLASALAADLSPEELIGHLGSPDRVVREEAARTLEERGDGALPALRAAREAADGPEARGRFAVLIERVESRLLDRPTTVALDFDDRPLGEAVEALAARSGFSLVLDDPALARRRVTARAPGRVPFWEAVDRLGRAGHVRHDPGPRRDAVGNDPQASAIRLVDGDPPAYTAYSGPLRIHLFGAHRHRDLSFQAAGNIPLPPSATVTVEVQAFAEPGRFLDPDGLPRLDVVDDRGRALPKDGGGGVEGPNPSEDQWLIPGRLSLLHWHVPLGLSDPPPRSPVRLRGVLPVVISSRKPGPLVVPLADAAGRTFRQDGTVVHVDQVATRDARNTSVTLKLSEGEGPPDRGRASSGPVADSVRDLVRNRLEFEDAAGRPLTWLLPGLRFPTTSGEFRLQALVSGQAPPARLRVYRLLRLATEIPFEFGDVPSP